MQIWRFMEKMHLNNLKLWRNKFLQYFRNQIVSNQRGAFGEVTQYIFMKILWKGYCDNITLQE